MTAPTGSSDAAPGDAPTSRPAPACSDVEVRATKLWVQIDAPFASGDEASRMVIAVDGRDVLDLPLRRQGSRMTHEHWGRATATLSLCRTEVVFTVRVMPLGLTDEQPLDLARGAYLVLSHDRARGEVRVQQHRTQPMYR